MADPITPYKGREAQPIIDQALALYEQGKEIEEAAKELDVPSRTIYRWLATNALERWRDAQQARLLTDYEASKKRREAARNNLEALIKQLDADGITEHQERNLRLSHSREVLKAADTDLDHQKWLLERLLKKIYGDDKNNLQVNLAPTLIITVAQEPGKVIEGEAKRVEEEKA